MDDLTIIYITANEMPQKWVTFQLKHLFTAICGAPVISISRIHMELGQNLLDTEPKSYWNMYKQLLCGILLAKTPYIAMVEDDVLYSKEHFTEFRPSLSEVSYNRSRWSLFSWDQVYCLRQRISNCSMIAPREYLIEALSERMKKYPSGNDYVGEVGRRKVEIKLEVTVRNSVEWYSTIPIIQLNHPSGTDDTQKRKWKKHGQLKAYDIPYWGKAEQIARIYSEGNS